MHMFFWFFKQLFYILKRFTKHKLILLFVFFVIAIFLFLKPSFATNTYNITGSNGITYSIPSNIKNFVLADYYSTSYNALVYSTDLTSTWRTSNINESGHRFGLLNNSGSFNVLRLPKTQTDFSQGTNVPWGAGYDITLVFPLIYNTKDIYRGTTNEVYFPASVVYPTITTSASSIIDFSFNYLTVDASSLPYDDYYEMRFTYPTVSTSHTGVINNFKTNVNGSLFFNIPKSWFTSDIVIRTGSRISFDLIKYHREGNAVTEENYSLGSYILDLTSQQQQEINEDSNKQLLSDINNNQKETTQAVENLENTITDSNVDDSSIFLPTLEVNDPTQVGINNIFDLLYNAFTTGDAEDIILPFPFTNKTITIPANLTYNVLHNNGGDILIRIIRAFWWYKIASFIAFDVFSKLKSIQEGNIEDVQKENIKGDML